MGVKRLIWSINAGWVGVTVHDGEGRTDESVKQGRSVSQARLMVLTGDEEMMIERVGRGGLLDKVGRSFSVKHPSDTTTLTYLPTHLYLLDLCCCTSDHLRYIDQCDTQRSPRQDE